MSSRHIFRSALVAAIFSLAACSNSSSDSSGLDASFPIGVGGEITGVLKIEQGRCGELGPATGSWFRMTPPDTELKDEPFVTNFDSQCPDQTYSLLSPGKVGLRTGEYQEGPNPPFDAATNGVADDIILPTRFYSVTFALSSEQKSPVTGSSLAAPRLFVSASTQTEKTGEATLTASLESLFLAWNGDWFEQGSPHPHGYRGNTSKALGTINLKTGRFMLTWNSEVEGGPFDGTTGVWHLEGFFVTD
jgi:hypothetical protein